MKSLKVKIRELQLGKIAGMLCFAVAMLSLSGCLEDDSENLPEPVPVAYVAIYHGAPAAPALDILIDSSPINSNSFEYTEHTTGYLPFYTGKRNIKFRPYNASNVLADTTANLKENTAYSVFVTADTGKVESVETLIIKDNITEPSAGKAVIRFVNLSPDAPAVDLAVSEGNGPMFEELSYREASSFEEIAAGPASIKLTNAEGGEVLISASDVNLQEGRVYTIVLRGYNSPPNGNNNGFGIQVIPNFVNY